MRPETQVRLDALAEMLSHWLARARHPAQFWPQFDVLAAEILDQCANTEKDHVRAGIQAMLESHQLELPVRHERGDSLPWRAPGD